MCSEVRERLLGAAERDGIRVEGDAHRPHVSEPRGCPGGELLVELRICGRGD
jgi:hypothetical protein